jgi:predicted DNA-binding transcriptional regulator AlpA
LEGELHTKEAYCSSDMEADMEKQERVLMRPVDISFALGVTTSRVYQLAAQGAFGPRVQVGARVYYRAAKFEEWINKHTDGGEHGIK